MDDAAADGHRDRGRPAGQRRRRARAAARARHPGAGPGALLVGGPAAELDRRQGLHARSGCRSRSPSSSLPTALLLFALTRSVLVPLKAIVLNLLTLLRHARRARRCSSPARSTSPRRCCCSCSSSGSRWTTRCSCSPGSRRSGTGARASRGERPRGPGRDHRHRPGRHAGGALDRHRLRSASRSASWRRSGRSASAWRSPCCSTSPWSAACCCPPRCRCSAAATGGLEPVRRRRELTRRSAIRDDPNACVPSTTSSLCSASGSERSRNSRSRGSRRPCGQHCR